MTGPACPHAASGCNYPEGDCADLCRRLDTFVTLTNAKAEKSYFAGVDTRPRWVADLRHAEAYTEKGATNLAAAFNRVLGGNYCSTEGARKWRLETEVERIVVSLSAGTEVLEETPGRVSVHLWSRTYRSSFQEYCDDPASLDKLARLLQDAAARMRLLQK